MTDRDARPGGFNPKHRVIGAIILVAVAVITVPLILNKNEPAEQDVKPAGDTKTVIAEVPHSAPPAPAPKPPVETTPMPSEPPSEISVTQPDIAPEPPASAPTRAPTKAPTPDKAQAPAQKSKTAAAQGDKGWFVQVGTFSNPDNARALADKLKRKGYPASLESVRVEQTKVVRVRVGPYPQDAKAKTVQAEIQKGLGIRGIVRHY